MQNKMPLPKAFFYEEFRLVYVTGNPAYCVTRATLSRVGILSNGKECVILRVG